MAKEMTKTRNDYMLEKSISGMWAGHDKEMWQNQVSWCIKQVATVYSILWSLLKIKVFLSIDSFYHDVFPKYIFSSQYEFSVSAILHKIYGATVLKITRMKLSMNEVQSACLAGTVKSWSTAALAHCAYSAAYFSHRKSYCYLAYVLIFVALL